jgi:hypothetical protein
MVKLFDLMPIAELVEQIGAKVGGSVIRAIRVVSGVTS